MKARSTSISYYSKKSGKIYDFFTQMCKSFEEFDQKWNLEHSEFPAKTQWMSVNNNNNNNNSNNKTTTTLIDESSYCLLYCGMIDDMKGHLTNPLMFPN
jgi:hypothetical protein